MKKLGVILFVSIIFFTNFPNVLSFENQISLFQSRLTIYVDGDNTQGPWNGTLDAPFQYITNAVENSTDGDLIYVFGGVYFENIVINKSIFLTGENKSETIIDGMYSNFILSINSDNVSIINFTIRNSGGFMGNAGIKIQSEDNQIKNCIITRTKTGIILYNSNNLVNDCIFHTNGEGIFIKSIYQNKVNNCYFTHNGIGINIDNSDSINITDCYAETNGIGIFVNNSHSINMDECALFNNNDNQGGIFLNHCINIFIKNCNVFHNGFGIKMDGCSNIYILNCNLSLNTHFAFHIVENSKEILIENNEIWGNLRIGVYLGNSNCILKNNNLQRSILGILSEHSNCEARYNWWGSPFGPALFEREKIDRIHTKRGRTTFFPWLIKEFESAGTTWSIDFELYEIEINTSQCTIIELPGEDKDNDGLPNYWEEKWGYDPEIWDDHENLDPDNDALNNFQECYTDEYGSNPFKKDVFLEFDWVESNVENKSINKPPTKYIEKIVENFEIKNISLHIDVGDLDGGEEISYIVNFTYSDLRDLYWNYFLHNDLNNPRKGIFHYCLVCDYGAGPGFAFIGWDSLDSFQISAQIILDKNPILNRGRAIIGGSIHELGHTMGLTVDDHGGNDNKVTTMLFTKQWWKYRNYKSCMNYRYTYQILNFSDGTRGKGDFDDWNNLDFSFFKNTHFIPP
jgi:parallel beta-helix repeat protein